MKNTFFIRLYEKSISFWYKSGDRAYRCHTFFFCCLFTLCGAAIYIGAVPTRVFGHDIFFLLDNGWRVINGQVPHVDFTSPWGPVTFLIVGLGLKLSDFSVDGVGYGSAIFGLGIGFWSYILCRNRLKTIPRILLSLFLTVLVLAPYPIGLSFVLSSHAMVYNRYGYALLGLVMVEVLHSTGDRQQSQGWWSGISSGASIALTLFLKANYFVAGIILIGASLIVNRFNRNRMVGISIGFSLVAFAILAFLRFDVVAVLKDLRMAVGARTMSVYLPHLTNKFLNNSLFFIIPALLIIQINKIEKTMFWHQGYKLLFIAAAVFGSDLLLLFSNQQMFQMPLSIILCLLLVNIAVARNQQGTETRNISFRNNYNSVLIFGGLTFLLFFTLDVSGLIYGVIQKKWPTNVETLLRFKEPRLAALLLYDNQGEPLSNGRNYTKYINEGIAVLKEKTEAHETILTLDMMNPFPYSMGRRPPIGGIAAAAYNYTLSDKHSPSGNRFFGNTDVVMVPKHPASPSHFFDGFYRIYKTTLDKHFKLVAESEIWYLYRRK